MTDTESSKISRNLYMNQNANISNISLDKEDFNTQKLSLNNTNISESPELLKRNETVKTSITERHVIMSSLTCGMGMGIFFASAQQLSCAGAIGIIISYSIVGVMIALMYQSCCELIVSFPGITLVDYAMIFIDESLGYAVSILYCLNQLIIFPLEIISTVMITETYIDLKNWKWCAVSFYGGLGCLLSFLNSKVYAEAEFILNFAKLVIMALFLMLGTLAVFGVIGNKSPIVNEINNGFLNPGGFNTQSEGLLIKKIISIFIISIFSCAGIEYSAMALLEQKTNNITRIVKKASYLIIGRFLFFYIAPFLIIGALVPYTNPNLLGSDSMKKDPTIPAESPFVLAFKLHNIKFLPLVINIVIILSLISVSNSALHTSSANLLTLCENFQIPRWVGKKNYGKPLRSYLISIGFGCLAFLIYLPNSETVFTYMVSIGGLSTMILWTIICISHIRFRYYLARAGIHASKLKYRSPTGIIGSFIAILINMVLFCLTFWTSLWPVGEKELSTENFLQVYLGIPVFVTLFIFHKLYTKFWRLKDRLKMEERDKLITKQLQLNEEFLDEEVKNTHSSDPYYSHPDNSVLDNENFENNIIVTE